MLSDQERLDLWADACGDAQVYGRAIEAEVRAQAFKECARIAEQTDPRNSGREIAAAIRAAGRSGK